jgi:hypothetical protein
MAVSGFYFEHAAIVTCWRQPYPTRPKKLATLSFELSFKVCKPKEFSKPLLLLVALSVIRNKLATAYKQAYNHADTGG